MRLEALITFQIKASSVSVFMSFTYVLVLSDNVYIKDMVFNDNFSVSNNWAFVISIVYLPVRRLSKMVE